MRKFLIPTIVATTMLGSGLAKADSIYIVDGKVVSKLEAIKILLRDKEKLVQQCAPVELTDKATLRHK